jgi:hypothetical protein
MKLRGILLLVALFGCVDRSPDNTIDNLTLQETAQRLTGFWKLKRIENSKGIEEFDLSSDEVKYIEFEGVKGIEMNLKDNRDGSFTTHSSDPDCELKEKDNKKIIEYSLIFNENWEYEIKSLSQNELVLVDTASSWTYIKIKVEGW